MHGTLRHVGAWLRRNLMFSVSLAGAAVTAVFVPPDREYIGYFDPGTLVSLFCVLTAVGALQNSGFFAAMARRIVAAAGSTRRAVLALTLIALLGSMFMTNDVALIAFLPLGFQVLRECGRTRHLALLYVLMTLAANLGGMLLPFGNPQNLFLYSYFHISAGEFLKIMAFPFALSTVLLLPLCLLVKSEPAALPAADCSGKTHKTRQKAVFCSTRRIAVFLILFFIVILAVLRVLPYPVGLIAPAALWFLDRRAVTRADYPLMGTFCAFFVFSGNLARIPAVGGLLADAAARSTLLTGAAASQLISNVPAAVLLARFTQNYPALLAAVNIGGVGTPIASLASLITLKAYLKEEPGRAGHFMRIFLILNFAFLAVLTLACLPFYR